MAERPSGGGGGAGTAEPERPGRSHEDRRARIEELKKQKRRKERAKTGLLLVIVLALLAVVFGRQAYHWIDNKLHDPLKRSIESFGVPLADAGCKKITTDAAGATKQHVEVGTRVEYDNVPPSSGKHYSNPVSFGARPFFTLADMPPVENLVHNLEHGYTILWYSDQLSDHDKSEIEGLARKLRNEAQYQQFIATAWDPQYGEFPDGKYVALSHWSDKDDSGETHGHRLLCAAPSGEAVKDFMTKFPASDAPERNIR